MFSHGTLLFDTDIEAMLKALNPGQVEVESKAVQSVRNFVINIRELLAVDMGIDALRLAILQGIFGGTEIPKYDLTESDWEEIRQISAARYRLWEWNFGHSPNFNVQKSERFPAGVIDVRIDVAAGRIESIRFYGDFAGLRDVAELEEQLSGVRYDASALSVAVNRFDVQLYFGELTGADLLRLLYGAPATDEVLQINPVAICEGSALVILTEGKDPYAHHSENRRCQGCFAPKTPLSMTHSRPFAHHRINFTITIS
jgi:lipoate-protein ligase A